MAATAKLDAEISNLNNADNLAVFFTEKGHCAHGAGIVDTGFKNGDIHGFQNRLIDNFLYLAFFFMGHWLEVVKVKTQTIWRYKGTCLFNMVAQYLL